MGDTRCVCGAAGISGLRWSGRSITFVIAVLVAAQAMSSLNDGQQACFFNYPAVACPTNEDPAIARLTFAFFGVPLIWLVGIGLTTLAWAWQRRRGAMAR